MTSLPSHKTQAWMCLHLSLSVWGYSAFFPSFKRGWHLVSQSRQVH